MDDKLFLKAYACAVNEENQFTFTHEAPIGTGYISVVYNHMDSPSGDDLSDNSFAAGEIEVWSDGYATCSIFCDEAAPRIVEDLQRINGGVAVPTQVIWESGDYDTDRWHNIKDFVNEMGLELSYSEEEAVEREIEVGTPTEKKTRSIRKAKRRKREQKIMNERRSARKA